MTPSARLRAVEGLLGGFQRRTTPLDSLMREFARNNRFAGAKDRRAIQDTLYAIVRSHEENAWRLGQAGAAASPRTLLFSHLVMTTGFDETLFGADKYGLAPLSPEEKALARRLGAVKEKPPEHARLNCPEWLYWKFRAAYPGDYAALLAALNSRAPVTLRVNRLKATPEDAQKAFAKGGITATPGRFCPDALVLEKPVPFHTLPGYREGWFEAQDEGSQLTGLVVDARPGRQVAELCAGAGGKSLELAAAMQNSGQIFAFDVDAKRLEALKARAERAGARNIQAARLPTGKPRAETLVPLEGRMDRVVVDAPCSGSGIFRRAPELKFRLTPEWLANHVKRQAALLEEAARLVKPGGALCYITCSLLPEENEGQITAFLSRNQGWKLRNYRDTLANDKVKETPETLSAMPEALLLAPHRHGTDGFFAALLQAPLT